MLIVGRKAGRLGNRLFTFAHFIGNAIEHNYKVFNPAFGEYAQYFVGTESQVLTLYPKGFNINNGFLKRLIRKILQTTIYQIVYLMVKRIIPWQSSAYHEVISSKHPEIYKWQVSGYLEFVHKKAVICNGWVFWDYIALEKHADLVRKFFELTDYYKERVQKIINQSRAEAELLIGVHIRQGDYARWIGGKYFFSLEQYAEVIANVQTLFGDKKVKFLIISNNTQVSDFFKGTQYCFGSGHFVEDIYALAGCDYIVGPTSTFSGWASFYGNVSMYCIEDPHSKIDMQKFKMFDIKDHLKNE